jgi:CheY-like chemotaxis protein
MGYTADLVSNGEEALAALDRKTFDLVFMDVMMPGLGGFETTRIIRDRQARGSEFPFYNPHMVVVAMTASAMQGDREDCLAAGMDDYIAKPVRPEDFGRIVEKWGALPSASTITPGDSPEDRPNLPAESTDPVNLERLLEFSDGDMEGLREMAALYLTQTAQQLEQLEAAALIGSADEVRRLAHSSAGASATCGVRLLVPVLRELERQGSEKNLANSAALVQQAHQEFECVREFLEKHVLPSVVNAPHP